MNWARLSPDGRMLAFVRGAPWDVWVKDLARGVVSRASMPGRSNQGPVWTPDRRSLVYLSDGGPSGRSSVVVRDVAGLAPERLLHEPPAGQIVIAEDVSPDGQHLMVRVVGSGKGADLVVVAMAQAGQHVSI